MTTKIFIDFETRSTVDLKKTGVYRYAADPDTDIWCMAWAINDGPVEVWTPGKAVPEFPMDAEYWAHNANFERIIWDRIGLSKYGFPLLYLEHWHCSAAQCAAMGLPRGLGYAAEALKLDYQKDKEGHAHMMRMSRPRTRDPLTWWSYYDRLKRLYAYCKRDVEVEREIEKYTRRLDDDERETYLLDQRMNDRGIRVDVALIKASKKIALEGMTRANAVIAAHTNGEVERVTQVAKMQRWLQAQGVDVDSLSKESVVGLLDKPLPYAAEKVLRARSEAGKSSVAKLDKMLDGRVVDRLQGLLLYHGAHTGRWTGRRVQPQNFPRPTIENVRRYIGDIRDENYNLVDLYDNPVEVVASLLRYTIVGSPLLFVGDYSAIEAIVLAWLAGEKDLLARFASDEDVYVTEAKHIGATRQHGKMVILGCGFGMGHQKFVDAAKQMFGLTISATAAKKFVYGYRERHPEIPQFWYALQDAFIAAIDKPDAPFMVGKIEVRRKGRYIWVTLPSGRPLCYVRPEYDVGTNTLSVLRLTLNGNMERRRIWGGVLAENITQAVARDVMVAGLKRLDAAGYNPVLTVHDEIICEPPEELAGGEFLALMSETPEWADGLPISAEGFRSNRYRKG